METMSPKKAQRIYLEKPIGSTPKPYDVTGNIIAFESGELADNEIITLFQHLVDNGMAWTLQGTYGRTAKVLIDAGLVKNNRA